MGTADVAVRCRRCALCGRGVELVKDAALLDRVRRAAPRAQRLQILLQGPQLADAVGDVPDVLVEQLIVTGHGMSALEGMATGLPVVSNLDDDTLLTPFRRWSFFCECPIVSATPENLVSVLRKLVTNPELRTALGRAGRTYVEKYHGLDSAVFLFSAVLDYVYGRRDSLIELCR